MRCESSLTGEHEGRASFTCRQGRAGHRQGLGGRELHGEGEGGEPQCTPQKGSSGQGTHSRPGEKRAQWQGWRESPIALLLLCLATAGILLAAAEGAREQASEGAQGPPSRNAECRSQGTKKSVWILESDGDSEDGEAETGMRTGGKGAG